MVARLEERASAGAEPSDEIPDTLLDLLMERLDRLGEAKWLAQVGAVLGREFPRELLFSVAEMAPAPFEASLQAMLASGLVLSSDGAGTRYLFKHALVEDTAYASILLKSRAALHGRTADVLLRDFRASTEHHPELVARHLSRARRPLEASRFWLAAGGQAPRARGSAGRPPPTSRTGSPSWPLCRRARSGPVPSWRSSPSSGRRRWS